MRATSSLDFPSRFKATGVIARPCCERRLLKSLLSSSASSEVSESLADNAPSSRLGAAEHARMAMPHPANQNVRRLIQTSLIGPHGARKYAAGTRGALDRSPR